MDDFTRMMFRTALWAETDDDGRPYDDNYSDSDIAKPVREALEEEAKQFQRENAADIAQWPGKGGRSDDPATAAGHDFWLTRNGHGAGFWDGDWPDEVGVRLDKASKKYGQVDLYVGDDGKIWASGYEKGPKKKPQGRKINQKDYTHYVVVSKDGEPRIESGWEYAEDAKEQIKGNLPEGVKAKVITKTGAKRAGLDPDDNDNWLRGTPGLEGVRSKAFIGEIDRVGYAIRIQGVDPEFLQGDQPFGRQTDAWQKIKEWKESGVKSDWISTKRRDGKRPMAEVKRWVKAVGPQEFFAKWPTNVDDDSLQIFYKI
jgi:hypothetical protein